MVHAIGANNILLSPPKKILGSYEANSPAKSILNPIARGIKPNIVVMAVRRTGRSLVLPP